MLPNYWFYQFTGLTKFTVLIILLLIPIQLVLPVFLVLHILLVLSFVWLYLSSLLIWLTDFTVLLLILVLPFEPSFLGISLLPFVAWGFIIWMLSQWKSQKAHQLVLKVRLFLWTIGGDALVWDCSYSLQSLFTRLAKVCQSKAIYSELGKVCQILQTWFIKIHVCNTNLSEI